MHSCQASGGETGIVIINPSSCLDFNGKSALRLPSEILSIRF